MLRKRTSAVGLVILLFGMFAHAADVSGLYETIVGPSTSTNRDSAFVEALRAVAVKATGQRDAGAKISPSVPNLRTFVQRFEPVRGDGSVLIEFDPAAVDRLLTNLGLPLWGRERPAILIWLSIPDNSGKPSWISADQTPPERELVERAAQARGLPILWPQMDAGDIATANALLASHSSGATVLASAERYRADGVLFGIGSRDASGGVTVRWTFALNGMNAADPTLGELQAPLDEGVQIAADRCASLFAAAANARSDVPIQIVGIQNLDGYAGAMNYLQGLTVVLGVAVEQFAGDSMRLRVSVRGDSAALRRAVELKGRNSALVLDQSPSSGDDTLKFRYLQ